MPTAHNGPIAIEYETFGDPTKPTIQLVMGFTAQMIAWRDAFCHQIADAGFHVVRHDNRDCGLSTKSEGPPPDSAAWVMAGMADRANPAGNARAKMPPAPYLLSDMAADAIAVLDALGVDQAHVVGASMGGMIVQTMAIEHPGRVATLTSIMSTTGDPDVGQAAPEAMGALLAPPPEGRTAIIEQGVTGGRIFGGPLFDEDAHRAHLTEAFDRMFHPVGAAFQMVAILASGDRTAALQALDVPTLVVHGQADSLIQVSGGKATAAAVPGARLVVLDEMGHDLPVQLWDTIIGDIADLTHS